MRAFAVRSFGDAPAIHDLPVPAAGDAFLLRVTYAGVNPLDNNNLARLTANSAYPFVLGIDFAGVVERVPAGETQLRTGDRVFGMARTHGAYAEYTAVTPGAKSEPLAPIPDGVTDVQAAALPTAAVTALRTVELLDVTPGQRLVVMGATGGVGGYAVQMALSLGAHVIATVRGDVDEARRLGAEEVYDSQAVDVASALRTAHPDGVDAVLDLVNGPDAIRGDAEFIKPGGRLVSTIFAADEGWFAGRQITARNNASSANPLLSPDGLTQVAGMLADGTITARVRSTAGLADAGEVLDKLRSGGLRGKAVIRITPQVGVPDRRADEGQARQQPGELVGCAGKRGNVPRDDYRDLAVREDARQRPPAPVAGLFGTAGPAGDGIVDVYLAEHVAEVGIESHRQPGLHVGVVEQPQSMRA
jgi:NADPH:quinone reductase-like Zn-dependent oxidoreductase